MPGVDRKREGKLLVAALLLLAFGGWLAPRLLPDRARAGASAGLERQLDAPAAAPEPTTPEEPAPLPARASAGPAAAPITDFAPRPAPEKRAALLEGIEGRVRDETGAAIPGAFVRLSIVASGQRRRLGAAITSRAGHYQLEVDLEPFRVHLDERAALEFVQAQDWSAELGSRDPEALHRLRARIEAALVSHFTPARVIAEIAHPGRQAARVERELPFDLDRPLRLDVLMRPGSGLSGSIYHRGDPLPGARVQLFDAQWQHLKSTSADERGEYELGLPDAGEYHVHARFDGLGASGTSAFTLGANLTPLEIDLDLGGEASLAFQVRLPDGEPLPFLELEALQYGLFQGELFGAPPVTPGDIARAESVGGLAHSIRRTDKHGKLIFTGLQDGRFGARFRDLRQEELQPTEAFSTGAQEHVLQLDVFLLTVAIDMRGGGRRRGRRAAVDLAPAQILVQPLPTGGPGGWRRPMRAFGDASVGRTSFLVEPGETYRVLAHGASGDAERHVTIQPTERITTVLLRLDEPDEDVQLAMESAASEPPGGVALVVLDEERRPLRELDVSVRCVGDDERAIPGAARALGAEGQAPLAPGEYVARVRLAGEAAGTHYLAEPERRFSVSSGKLARVALEARPGGRLKLRVGRAAGAAGALEVVLSPLDGGGPERRPEFAIEGDWRPRRTLRPEDRALSEVLPPGRYELRIESGELQAEPREVELRAGSRHDLELRVERRPDGQ